MGPLSAEGYEQIYVGVVNWLLMIVTIDLSRLRSQSRDNLAPGEDAPAAGDDRAPAGTIKARIGATHFLMKTLPRVASEIALHVLAYNLTRVMNIMGIAPLMAAIRA